MDETILDPVPQRVGTAIEERPLVVASGLARELGINPRSADQYLRRLAHTGHLARRGLGIFTRPRLERAVFALTDILRRAEEALGGAGMVVPVVGWTTAWVDGYAPNVFARHWTVFETTGAVVEAVADVLASADVPAVVYPGMRRGLPFPERDLGVVFGLMVVHMDLNIARVLAHARRRYLYDEILACLMDLKDVPDDVREAIRLVAGGTVSPMIRRRSRSR